MRLSMWMIANRLASFEPDLAIRDNAPEILKSARRAYATNCVHVYQSGDGVDCRGEEDVIHIRNGSEAEVFELIQGIFDYYDDWMDSVTEAARIQDYQLFVERAWRVFQNPLVLMDGNSKVLGISRYYPAEEMDDEWNYLCQFGYSSLNSLSHMHNDPAREDLQNDDMCFYHFTTVPQILFSGLTCKIFHKGILCGNLVLLAKERPLNTGDRQLLQKLAEILEPYLGQETKDRHLTNSYVFYNLLLGKSYNPKELERQLDYQGWKTDDPYQVALVMIDKQDMARFRLSLMKLVVRNMPSLITIFIKPYVILISNREFSKLPEFIWFQDSLLSHNPIWMGYSLVCSGINSLPYLYSQAEAAIKFGELYRPEQKASYFQDHVIEYILSCSSLEDQFHACCPSVRKLWEMQQENGSELFQTLKCYLDQERSIARTASALFTHRNTIVYRIKKLQELLPENLDYSENRNYIRLSIRILEMYERNKGKKYEKTSFK